jgi:glycosyltransferase involved in cell wall biosynthesis
MSSVDVLFVMNTLAVGGSEKKVVRLANRLAERGLQVGCAYFQKPSTLEQEFLGSVALWCLDRSGKISWRVLRQLSSIVATTKPAAVIAVNLYPSLYAAFLRAESKPRRISLINTSSFVRGRDRWFLPLYQWALRQMDTVVFGSETQRDGWIKRHSRVWRQSRVIYNGVDASQYLGLRAADSGLLHIPPERFVFGSVGRLAPEKNHGLLIEVLQRQQAAGVDAHLVLVGEGVERQALEVMARKLGVGDRITFLGQVADVRPALSIMDVFVLPSIAVETFSNAALEAMAMGKPVILSNIGGASEMLDHGTEGFVLALESLRSELPRCLLELQQNPPRRQAMGRAARARVLAKFTFDGMVEDYLRIIGGAGAGSLPL